MNTNSSHLHDEKKLIEAAQNDKEILGKLYEIYQKRIKNYLLAKVNYDKFAADDLTSATFEKVVANIKNFKWQGISFSAWIYRIANNTLIDYYRAASAKSTQNLNAETEAIIKDPNLGVEERITAFDSSSRIRKLLDTLGEREKQVVLLKFYEGYTNKMIAEKIGITETNVGTILHRSMQKLRELPSLEGYV